MQDFINPREQDLSRYNLTDKETSCISSCATTYAQMISQMGRNFEKRTTIPNK